MSKTGSQRLFFALWPDEALRNAVALCSRYAIAGSGGRAVPPRNFHVTLAFLGEVANARVLTACSVADAVEARGFELSFERIETWRRPSLLVLATRHISPGLQALVAELRRGLSLNAFATERRLLRPHVTLARTVNANQELELPTPLHWRAKDFVLVRSDLKPVGSEYSVLHRWRLVRGDAESG